MIAVHIAINDRDPLPGYDALRSAGQRLLDRSGNFRDRQRRKLRIQRQREHLLRGLFGVWKVAPPVAQISIRRLQMRRHGIMNAGLDSIRLQRRLQAVAIVAAQSLDVIYVPDPRHLRR
jgi:hypothetical protein